MAAIEIRAQELPPMPPVATYIAVCHREWIMAAGQRGRCGDCGTAPVYLRPGPVVGGRARR
jgi:hypothetical protein